MATVPLGMQPATVNDLKAKAVGEFVSLGFVNLDEHVFFGLRRDLPLGIDFSPIEHASMVIKLAAGSEELCLGEAAAVA